VSEESTQAELARALVDGANRGTLCTIGLDPPGYPFGSVANYAVDDVGRPLLFVSVMAEHTRNARADSRASLLVAEAAPEGSDPLAVGRVTLVGDLMEVSGEERAAARARFLKANPATAGYIDFADFSFWRLEVRAVRYVGGYGRMGWVEAADYAKAGAPRNL
jgi:heme oxygenase (biliverdin-IX-beta and delta-forming)